MTLNPVQIARHSGVYPGHSFHSATVPEAYYPILVVDSVHLSKQTTAGISHAGVLAPFGSGAHLGFDNIILFVHLTAVGQICTGKLNVQLVPTGECLKGRSF